MKIGIFDLGSFFWTLAGARSKEEGAAGLALQVLRYMKDRAEKSELDVVLMASDGPPAVPSRSWRLRVDPGYKGHRAPKDEMQRAELVALNDALIDAGFPVVSAVEGLVAHDAEGHPERWFEADDIAYSAAKKVASSSTEFEAHVFSNDWDLAQVLKDNYRECATCAAKPGSPELCEECLRRRKIPDVRLFTTRGVERTAADVEREFGCSPAKLAELKALAGDTSDGYKPFPGEAPGKPGIGEKGAADILKAFGSAHSAMAAALSNLDLAFQQKGLPKRLPALLRKGGEAALERGLKLATLRLDVPVPDGFDVGDWEEAEAALLERKIAQAQPEMERPIEGVPFRSAVPEGVLPPIDKIRAASMDREAEAVERALKPRDRRVFLTKAEFLFLAPLPVLYFAGAFAAPASVPGLEELLDALRDGDLGFDDEAGLYAGEVTAGAAAAVAELAAVCARIRDGGLPDPNLVEFEDFMRGVPHSTALADYGKPFARAR